MRIARSQQLWPENGTVHLYWRCHNKEPYLEDTSMKTLYLNCLKEALEYKDQHQNCKIHSFCVMINHYHQSTSYYQGSLHLSRFMQYAHSLFGAHYNQLHDRSGKVAESRPKTPLIQDDSHEMRVQFYIEANPLRAGFRTLENLKNYVYSSYGFYAYGIKTPFTELLTTPEWYVRLGKTPRERQRRYRKLFKEYLETYSKSYSRLFKRYFIGDALWVEEARLRIKKIVLFKTKQKIRFISLAHQHFIIKNFFQQILYYNFGVSFLKVNEQEVSFYLQYSKSILLSK